VEGLGPVKALGGGEGLVGFLSHEGTRLRTLLAGWLRRLKGMSA
jgi:hypothetical protein